MDAVTIKGVEYQRVSLLAKKFKYTTDYIGQLCRAKKVDAQLVGRSWYVNPLSLESHKKSRHAKSTTTKTQIVSEKSDDKANKIKISRVDVDPVVTKNIVKTTSQRIGNFAKRIDWKPVKYEYDESDLLPSLHDSIKAPTSLNVNLAEATGLPVKNNPKSTRLVADELPTVSLKGKLKVDSLDESFDVDVENEDITVQDSVEPAVISKAKIDVVPTSSASVKSFNDRLSLKQENISLTPKSIAGTENLIPKKESTPISQKIYSGLLIVVVILIFSLIALLTVNSNQAVDTLLYESTVSFSLDDFFSLFSHFSR